MTTLANRTTTALLVVTGAETDACVRSTLHGAFVNGYDVTLVADAHTAGDKTSWGAPPVSAVLDHTNLDWSYQAAPDAWPPSPPPMRSRSPTADIEDPKTLGTP